MVRQARIVDPARRADATRRKLRDRERVGAVPLHAQGSVSMPCSSCHALIGESVGAVDAQRLHARLHREAEVAEGLVEAARRGSRATAPSLPGNLPLSHGKRPVSTITPPIVVPWPPRYLVAEWTTMSAPMRERVAQVRRRHRVVDDQRHAVRVRDFGDGGDVEHAAGSDCRALSAKTARVVGRIAARRRRPSRRRRRRSSRCRTCARLTASCVTCRRRACAAATTWSPCCSSVSSAIASRRHAARRRPAPRGRLRARRRAPRAPRPSDCESRE